MQPQIGLNFLQCPSKCCCTNYSTLGRTGMVRPSSSFETFAWTTVSAPFYRCKDNCSAFCGSYCISYRGEVCLKTCVPYTSALRGGGFVLNPKTVVSLLVHQGDNSSFTTEPLIFFFLANDKILSIVTLTAVKCVSLQGVYNVRAIYERCAFIFLAQSAKGKWIKIPFTARSFSRLWRSVCCTAKKGRKNQKHFTKNKTKIPTPD